MVGKRTQTSRNLGFADVLSRWTSTPALAEDLGIPESTVRSWVKRDSVPQRYWGMLEQSAKRRGIRGVNYTLLREIDARIHPPRGQSSLIQTTASPRPVETSREVPLAHFATNGK